MSGRHCAVFQFSKVDPLFLASPIHCCFEGILVVSVDAMVDLLVICFCVEDALAGDITAALLLAPSQAGRAAGEFWTQTLTRTLTRTMTRTRNWPGILTSWTFLVLPLLLLAPGQLSLTAGVASADCLPVIVIIIDITGPLPLFDAFRCVDTGRHMGSATEEVSAFIIIIVVAGVFAALIQVQGGAIFADAWRPLGPRSVSYTHLTLPPILLV